MKNIIVIILFIKSFYNLQAQNKISPTKIKPFIGTFYGLQRSHAVGKIKGNDVIVPDINYRFYLDEKKEVELAQTADGKTYYYLGKYAVNQVGNGDYMITCKLYSYPEIGSYPTYQIIFKSDGTILCKQLLVKTNSPEFHLEKKNQSNVSNVNGLTSNTRYYVRGYATNSAGTGYGNEINFNTNNINIQNGLIGYYPFSGNAGDSSGYNNHGTVVGAKLSSDRFGINDRSYLFNRSTDNYISIKTNKLFDTLKNVSISLWVKINSYNMPGQAGYNHFINKTDGTNHQFIFANNGTQLYFYNGPSLNQLNSTKNLPTLNKWSHLVLTYFYESGNSQSSCKFYIDGNLVDSFTTNSNLTPNTANIRIGDYMSMNINRVDGNLDDIRIYNRPLTIDEIKYLFTMTGS
jgi:hypothetical protein